jgi:hypothetical protein
MTTPIQQRFWKMMGKIAKCSAAFLALLYSASIAQADAAMESYLRNAAPVMHYSCASLVEDAGKNEERILEVVRMMVGVSFYNRQIDITEYNTSAENIKEIKSRFIAELKEACAKDNDALLAGIVDTSVRKILVE